MKFSFTLLIFTFFLLSSCSSEDDATLNPARATYEIDVDIRFEQRGYTMDVSYLNDSNQDKIRFEEGNEDRLTNSSIKSAESSVGIYLNSFRTIPTNSIRVIIRNLDTNEIVVNENITRPISSNQDRYMSLFYNINTESVSVGFNQIINLD